MQVLRATPSRVARPRPLNAVVSTLTCLLLALACATSAQAQTRASSITKDKGSPIVNEAITFRETQGVECPGGSANITYEFTVDGVQQAPQSSQELSRSFSTSGSHAVSSTTSCDAVVVQRSGTLTFDVAPAVGGSITVDPDPPLVNQPATLSAAATGGYPGYDFSWDLDNDGAFDDATTRVVQTTFTSTAPRTVRVRIVDRATAPEMHTGIVTRTITAVTPPPGTPPPTTPPPTTPPPTTPPPADGAQPPATPPVSTPTCRRQIAFELSEFTTTGCFRRTGTTPSERWETTSAVQVNGIPFEDFGQTFTIKFPSSADPGGHFAAPNSAIKLGGFTAFSGNVAWQLPVAPKGDEPKVDKLVKSFPVLFGTKLFGLAVSGSVALKFGRDTAGGYYATFPLNIELPGNFRAGPDPSLGKVTGSAVLKVDAGGIRFDGLRLEAENVWIGKVKVVSVCFSFVPAGGRSLADCPPLAVGGKEFISCAEDPGTDRWNGSALIKLPGKNETKLGAFGGLADGRVSKLGGSVEGLGRTAPIATNVFLDKVAVGLCFTPPPFKIKGTVGVAVFPVDKTEAVGIDGSLEYTDEVPGSSSWKLELGGAVQVFDQEVGTGSVTLRGYGGVDFKLEALVNLFGAASLEGSVKGWVDQDRYSIEGAVTACVGGFKTGVCLGGSGILSHVGIAGCVSVTTSFASPDLLISFDPFRARFATSTITIRTGFGHRWKSGTVDIFANSCDFGPYRPTRAVGRAAQAGSPLPQTIAKGTAAVSWRIAGSDGPPKVVIRGPGGAVISSPSVGRSAQVKGRYMLVENPTNGTTNVVLIKPAAGRWTVEGALGARSTPTKVDSALAQAPPSFSGQVSGSGEVRTLNVGYAVPPGTSVQLVERATGIGRTLTKSLRGRRCPGGPKLRPGSDQRILCAKVRFRPSRGPGGKRTIEAVVTRNGIPVQQKDFVSFTAPRQTMPQRPAALRARRSGGSLVVNLPRVRGASRFAVGAVLTDGRKLSYDLARSCRAVRIANVPTAVGATVRVAGVRYDLEMGRVRSVTIRSKVASVGPRGKVPSRPFKPVAPCV